MLSDISKEAMAHEAFRLLKQLMGKHGETLEAEFDLTQGLAIVDGISFTYSGGSLRMMGFCQQCGAEVISKPIRKVADIADMQGFFRAEKHSCILEG